MTTMPAEPTIENAVADLANVGYIRTFTNDQSPAIVGMICSLNGFRAPSTTSFRYLEIGCGQGFTLLVLAASYPEAQFIGVDLAEEHIAVAKQMAEKAGLANIQFYCLDFAELPEAEVGGLDYVTMYGVMTWISPEKRVEALKFASKNLRDGGLFFTAYNAQPGWSAVAPLRRLLLDCAATQLPASPQQQAQYAFGVAELLSSRKARYFTENPAAERMLDAVRRNGLTYGMHEYLATHWHPMYFEDVAKEMASEQLHYVGQAPLFLNYRDLAIPQGMLAAFQSITNRITFESLKDYARNEFFRRDIFIKGTGHFSAHTPLHYLDSETFGTLVHQADIQREVQLSDYKIQYTGPVFDQLIDTLTAAPQALRQAIRTPKLADLGIEPLRDGVRKLLLGNQIVPYVRPSPILRSATANRYEIVSAFNKLVLEQDLSEFKTFVFACERTGQGLLCSQTDAIMLRCLTSTNREWHQEWLRALVESTSSSFIPIEPVQGTKTQEQKLANLVRTLERFTSQSLPKYVQLGIVQAAE